MPGDRAGGRVAWLVAAFALAAIAGGLAFLAWESSGDSARTPADPNPNVAPTAMAEPAVADPASRVARTTDAPPPAVAPRPVMPLSPGSTAAIPIDITNIASAELGIGFWARLITEPGEWTEVWQLLHERDLNGLAPEDMPEGAPEFEPRDEVLLAIGLGDRPQIDYAFNLEPVAPRFDEACLRLRTDNPSGKVVPVATRPVRVWILSRAALRKRPLVIADQHGNELARFDPVAEFVPEEEPDEDDDAENR